MILDILAQLGAVFYPYAISMVNLYGDLVIRAHCEVNKKILLALQPFIY